jgi:uncharacterized MnhB-related membrane protein
MTVTVLTLIIAVLVPATALFGLRVVPGVRAYFKFSGTRLVTCPETEQFEAVDVAAAEVALGAFLNQPTLRLTECSRWPEGGRTWAGLPIAGGSRPGELPGVEYRRQVV